MMLRYRASDDVMMGHGHGELLVAVLAMNCRYASRRAVVADYRTPGIYWSSESLTLGQLRSLRS